jgi:hypothetical protein
MGDSEGRREGPTTDFQLGQPNRTCAGETGSLEGSLSPIRRPRETKERNERKERCLKNQKLKRVFITAVNNATLSIDERNIENSDFKKTMNSHTNNKIKN